MSKTKETIYFEESNKELPDGIYPGMANTKVYNAMQVYAKQQCMAYAKFIKDGQYQWDEGEDAWVGEVENENNVILTEIELYDLFLQSNLLVK